MPADNQNLQALGEERERRRREREEEEKNEHANGDEEEKEGLIRRMWNNARGEGQQEDPRR